MCVHNFWDNHRNDMNNVHVQNNEEGKEQAPFDMANAKKFLIYYYQTKGFGYLWDHIYKGPPLDS